MLNSGITLEEGQGNCSVMILVTFFKCPQALVFSTELLEFNSKDYLMDSSQNQLSIGKCGVKGKDNPNVKLLIEQQASNGKLTIPSTLIKTKPEEILEGGSLLTTTAEKNMKVQN